MDVSYERSREMVLKVCVFKGGGGGQRGGVEGRDGVRRMGQTVWSPCRKMWPPSTKGQALKVWKGVCV